MFVEKQLDVVGGGIAVRRCCELMLRQTTKPIEGWEMFRISTHYRSYIDQFDMQLTATSVEGIDNSD